MKAERPSPRAAAAPFRSVPWCGRPSPLPARAVIAWRDRSRRHHLDDDRRGADAGSPRDVGHVDADRRPAGRHGDGAHRPRDRSRTICRAFRWSCTAPGTCGAGQRAKTVARSSRRCQPAPRCTPSLSSMGRGWNPDRSRCPRGRRADDPRGHRRGCAGEKGQTRSAAPPTTTPQAWGTSHRCRSEVTPGSRRSSPTTCCRSSTCSEIVNHTSAAVTPSSALLFDMPTGAEGTTVLEGPG